MNHSVKNWELHKLKIRDIISFIGEDPDREGLLETPDRVLKSYQEMFSGYQKNPADVMKTFEDGACDEIVLLKNISFTSFCEHHLLPFWGVAHIAYLPKKRIVGISKLVRLLEIFSKRLQIQERLTTQIADALEEYLKPNGSACIIEARHFCMMGRGVKNQESVLTTSSLKGIFLESNEVRQELMQLIKL